MAGIVTPQWISMLGTVGFENSGLWDRNRNTSWTAPNLLQWIRLKGQLIQAKTFAHHWRGGNRSTLENTNTEGTGRPQDICICNILQTVLFKVAYKTEDIQGVGCNNLVVVGLEPATFISLPLSTLTTATSLQDIPALQHNAQCITILYNTI